MVSAAAKDLRSSVDWTLPFFLVQIDIDLGVGVGVDKLDGLGDNADAVAAAQGIDGWAGRLSPGTA